jgi:hypothetical protein
MKTPLYPNVHFYNVEEGGLVPFVQQCQAFVQAVRDGIGGEDVAAVLDQLHSVFRLRCHGMDRCVHYHDDEDDREEIVLAICDAFDALLRVEIDRADLLRRYEWLTRKHSGNLAIVRVDDPHALVPADSYGWWACCRPPLQYQAIVMDVGALHPAPELATAKAAIKSAIEARAEPARATQLTRAQAAAMPELRHHWRMRRQNPIVCGISPRPFPLIAAASGAGKTFLIAHFAKIEDVPLLKMDASSWIVSGATNRPYSLEIVSKFVGEHSEGIIAIDEVDKAENDSGSSWTRHVRGEIYSLLDERPSESSGWDPKSTPKLRDFLIVGLGTWQALHRPRPSLGFGETRVEQVDLFRANSSIPEELLYRFNSRVIHLPPAEAPEFALRIAAIHREIGVPAPPNLAQLACAAVESGLQNRWLETYLSDVLRARHESVGAKLAARLRSAERAKAHTGEAPNDI